MVGTATSTACPPSHVSTCTTPWRTSTVPLPAHPLPASPPPSPGDTAPDERVFQYAGGVSRPRPP
eukprot:4082717-Prymnesium_polylepis.1